MPTVYLAGPMVFEPDPAATFATMKAICAQHGLVGVSPLDNQMALGGSQPGHDLISRIVAADIELMHTLDAGLFCLDSFRRSPEMDPGTAFEIGYMHALNKPLEGWTQDPRKYPARVQAFFANTFNQTLDTDTPTTTARSGQLRDPDGILVHSETCLQNAMCHIGIERSGGTVHADATWSVAFERAIASLATRLRPAANLNAAQA